MLGLVAGEAERELVPDITETEPATEALLQGERVEEQHKQEEEVEEQDKEEEELEEGQRQRGGIGGAGQGGES